MSERDKEAADGDAIDLRAHKLLRRLAGVHEMVRVLQDEVYELGVAVVRYIHGDDPGHHDQRDRESGPATPLSLTAEALQAAEEAGATPFGPDAWDDDEPW